MRLRHATPGRNMKSIGRSGLLCSKSQGRMKVVWFHTPGRSTWAVLHVSHRHNVRAEDVAIIEAEIPRKWLRRARKGLWYSRVDVPPERFRRFVGFIEVAGPAADECQ